MTFTSYGFLVVFLPLVLVAFLLLERWRRPRANMLFLIAASVVFYVLGAGVSIWYVVASIIATYIIGQAIIQARDAGRARLFLLLGLAVTLLPLLFFKYAHAIPPGFGFGLAALVMPLAMSFITFQQVIYLVSRLQPRERRLGILEYATAILLFPKLISGPITHPAEMAGQFARQRSGVDLQQDLAIGGAYFSIGLFKKVVIADHLRPSVDSVFAALDAGGHLPLLDAWAAVLTFFVMLYFDFSGYTDMAIGVARMLGFVLPQNFNSPLRATSLVSFWTKWHMTLMKFLTNLVYSPLALWRTRAAMQARRGPVVLFLEAAAFPAMVTMLVSGVWHGGGWNFVLFGALHGVGLAINQAWRQFRLLPVPGPLGWAMTFLFLAVTLVLFRAAGPDAAFRMFGSLIGLGEIRLPAALAGFVQAAGVPGVVVAEVGSTFPYFTGGTMQVLPMLTALALALILPNSAQILEGQGRRGRWIPALRWQPTAAWAIAVAVLLGISFERLGRGYEPFVYFQF